MRQRLEAMINLAEATSCRTKTLLACFGESLEKPCGHCDACLTPFALFDGTKAAQQALSAIYRTGQIFGAKYIVDVLRGEKTAAVDRNGHDKLALFGIGRDRAEAFWRGVLRQLVARGALRIKSGEYASLELVQEEARPILRGETQVMLREDGPPVRASRAASRARCLAHAAGPTERRPFRSFAKLACGRGKKPILAALRDFPRCRFCATSPPCNRKHQRNLRR